METGNKEQTGRIEVQGHAQELGSVLGVQEQKGTLHEKEGRGSVFEGEGWAGETTRSRERAWKNPSESFGHLVMTC